MNNFRNNDGEGGGRSRVKKNSKNVHFVVYIFFYGGFLVYYCY